MTEYDLSGSKLKMGIAWCLIILSWAISITLLYIIHFASHDYFNSPSPALPLFLFGSPIVFSITGTIFALITKPEHAKSRKLVLGLGVGMIAVWVGYYLLGIIM